MSDDRDETPTHPTTNPMGFDLGDNLRTVLRAFPVPSLTFTTPFLGRIGGNEGMPLRLRNRRPLED